MRIISLFWLLITSLTVFGQMRYPVQVEARVAAPSVFLADYKSPQNVSVRVVLHDLTKDNYTVQLKMSLKSPTATFTTVNPLSITLNGGEVHFLNHSELEFLFGQLSAAFTGGAMQEDIYILSFEAFDARVSGLAVSNAKADFTQFKVNLVAAPMQTMPQDKAMLDNMGGTMPLMFSWMQSTVGMPAGQQIRYRLVLAKITNDGITPEMAIASATISNPSTIIVNDIPYNSYLLNDFSITPGDRYAWQVQSYEEIDGIATPVTTRFKDGGLSPVHSFTIKENCESILPLKKPEIQNDANGEPQIALEWKESPSHQMYEIKYRPVGAASSWNVIQQEIDNTLTLGADLLKAGQTYEYTVAARCRTWQPAQYGGTFSIDAPSCPAPENLQIKTNTPAGIVLAWDAVASASSYLVTYSTASASDKQTVSSPAATLPAITTGSYTVQVDAVCASATGNGKPTTFNWDANGYLGECLIPKPFDLSVSTFDDKGSLSASLIWTAAPQHTAYTFTYTKDGTSTQTLLQTEDPYGTITKLSPNTLYHYTLQYFCGTRSVTTPTGMFRTDDGAQPVNIAPGTADCFPPAYISAEARSLTSAEFAWKKTGADEYQLMYAPAGTQNFKTFSTTGSDCQIKDLVSGGKYDYKLRTRCGADFSIFSALGTVDLSKSTLNTKCDTLPFVKVIKTTKTEVQLAWKYELGTDSKPLRSGYEILYIDAAQDWSEQYTTSLMNMTEVVAKNVTKDSVTYTVINLNPGTTYKFKLRAYCGTDAAQTNAIVSGTTKSGAPKGDCENGRTCDRSSKVLLTSIKVGDTIQVADYSLKVATIEKLASGYWKGTGTAEAPFIGFSENIALEATFNNLQVNDASCVIGGEIDIKKATGYILDESQRTKLEAAMAKANDYIDKAASAVDAAQNGIDQAQEVTAEAADYFQGGGDVGSVKTGSLGEKYTTSEELTGQKASTTSTGVTIGGTAIPTADLPALVKDKSGDVYSVDKEGNTTKIGTYSTDYPGIKDQKPDNSKVTVTFSANSDQKYGFDAFRKEYAERPMMEPHYLKLDGKYYSAKAITPGDKDVVDFEVTGASKSDITFVNRDGFEFVRDGGEVILAGGPAKDAQEVFAVYNDGTTKTVVGALLLASYPRMEKVVKLILTDKDQKVTASDVADIAAELNHAYEQAGVTYRVELDNSLVGKPWCGASSCSFTPTGSAMLSNDYTGNEAQIIDYYTSQPGFTNDPAVAYMFAIGATIDNTGGDEGGLQGKMNFDKQFGFLYNVRSGGWARHGRTMAHEIGHGCYKLYHIFDDMYLGASAKEGDNLMGYSTSATANKLNKLQWDIVAEPGVTWGVMASDKDQEKVIVTDMTDFASFKNTNQNSFTFFTPSGHYITIPGDVKGVTLSTIDRYYSLVAGTTDKSFPSELFNTMGVLTGFTTADGKTWNSRASGSSFVGYCSGKIGGSSCEYYKDELSPALKPTKGIILFVGIKTNKFVQYVTATKSLNQYTSTSDYSIHSGPIVKTVLLKGQSAADLNKTLTNYINSIKTADSPVEIIDGDFILENESVKVPVCFGSDITTKEFLLKLLDENSSLHNYIVMFTLVNSRQNEFEAYADCLRDNIKFDETRFHSLMSNAKMQNIGALYGYTARASYDNIKSTAFDVLVYRTANEITLDDQLDKAIKANKTAADIYNLITTNKHDRCVLRALNINTRIKVMGMLISDDKYWKLDTRNLIEELITTTPDYDELKLLKDGFMANNFKWIYQLTDQISEWLDVNEGADLNVLLGMSTSLNKLIERNFSSLGISLTTATVYDLGIDGFTSYEYYPGQEAYLLGAGAESYNPYDNVSYSVDFTASITKSSIVFDNTVGKVHLKQDYSFYDGTPMFEDANKPHYVRRTKVSYDNSFNPFEPITLVFAKNYGKIGYDGGYELIVPAYEAILLAQAVQNYNDEAVVRYAADVAEIAITTAAILSAPPTGGASLALFAASVTATVAAQDILILNSERTETTEGYQRGIYESWDSFKLAVDLGSVALASAPAAISAANKLPAAVQRMRQIRAWKEFNALCATHVSSLKPGLMKIWTAVKGMKGKIATTIYQKDDKILDFIYISESKSETINVFAKNVCPGTNGKFAIIGRSMTPVEKVADKLIGMGKEVVILNDKYLDNLYKKGLKFHIEEYDAVLTDGTKVHFPAQDWTVNSAWDDMTKSTYYNKIKEDVNGILMITNKVDIVQTPMYKVNKMWIELMKKEGYEIIDIGNPFDIELPSFFYTLERETMSWPL